MSALPTSYINYQASVVLPYLKNTKTLLDFGCGDMAMDKILIEKNKRITIAGVDVTVEHIEKISRLTYFRYDGNKLPFPNRSFDTVLSYHVFHHCDNPMGALDECIRVGKKHILIIEPTMRCFWEKPFFMVLDILTNTGRKTNINMPFHIYTREYWSRELRRRNLTILAEKNVSRLPSFLPVGIATLLYCSL